MGGGGRGSDIVDRHPFYLYKKCSILQLFNTVWLYITQRQLPYLFSSCQNCSKTTSTSVSSFPSFFSSSDCLGALFALCAQNNAVYYNAVTHMLILTQSYTDPENLHFGDGSGESWRNGSVCNCEPRRHSPVTAISQPVHTLYRGQTQSYAATHPLLHGTTWVHGNHALSHR